MATKPYNAVDHALYLTTFDDVTFIAQGEPDADFIAVTFVNDSSTATEGAKGDVQFSQRIASLGNIAFTCQWGSSTNETLNQVFADQQNGSFLKSAKIKRISETENVVVWECVNPKIVKRADYTIGIAPADRAWNFLAEKLTPGERSSPV